MNTELEALRTFWSQNEAPGACDLCCSDASCGPDDSMGSRCPSCKRLLANPFSAEQINFDHDAALFVQKSKEPSYKLDGLRSVARMRRTG
jgi:hypothetical protein